MLEHGVGNVNLLETEIVVEDAHHRLFAQQGGVQLDRRVQSPFLQQVPTDLFDFAWGATVHGRKGNAVDDPRRDLDVSELGELFFQNRPDFGDFLRRILQSVHETSHRRAPNSLQVVADAHVEDRSEGNSAFKAEDPVENVDQYPGFDVLPCRLI
ncbi:hypothetical protein ES703_98689 [subsurface metagenome]